MGHFSSVKMHRLHDIFFFFFRICVVPERGIMGHLLAQMAIWWVSQFVAKGTVVISCMCDSKVFHAFYKSVPLKVRVNGFIVLHWT